MCVCRGRGGGCLGGCTCRGASLHVCMQQIGAACGCMSFDGCFLAEVVYFAGRCEEVLRADSTCSNFNPLHLCKVYSHPTVSAIAV